MGSQHRYVIGLARLPAAGHWQVSLAAQFPGFAGSRFSRTNTSWVRYRYPVWVARYHSMSDLKTVMHGKIWLASYSCHQYTSRAPHHHLPNHQPQARGPPVRSPKKGQCGELTAPSPLSCITTIPSPKRFKPPPSSLPPSRTPSCGSASVPCLAGV